MRFVSFNSTCPSGENILVTVLTKHTQLCPLLRCKVEWGPELWKLQVPFNPGKCLGSPKIVWDEMKAYCTGPSPTFRRNQPTWLLSTECHWLHSSSSSHGATQNPSPTPASLWWEHGPLIKGVGKVLPFSLLLGELYWMQRPGALSLWKPWVSLVVLPLHLIYEGHFVQWDLSSTSPTLSSPVPFSCRGSD